MIVSLPSGPGRLALAGFALIVTLYLGYGSVRAARATYYTEKNTLQGYEKATQIEPENARNWYLLGRYLQYSLEDGDPQRAIESYQQSLKIDPGSSNTWLDLAAVYESEGDDKAARNAFLSAKKVYPLSAEASWRYGNFLLRVGELDAAFAEIKSSVSADPTRATEAFSRCVRIEPDPDVILDKIMPPNPKLYLAVMQDLAGERDTVNAVKVWKRVAALHPKITMPEMFVLTDTLRQQGQFDIAHEVWEQASNLAGVEQLEGPQNSAMWDGGFETEVTGMGYAWRIGNVARAAQIGFENREQHSGKHSIRVSFDGSSDVSFRDVCQPVLVDGGKAYELSGWIQTKDLTTDEGIRLELRAQSTRVMTDSLKGTQPWTRVAVPWEGVPESQEVQVCLLRMPSALEDNNKIRGTAYVDDIALTPLAKTGSRR
jgi:tetratricopeptide (TPR) repeat protein